MGACDISFNLDGKKTFSDVLKAFKRQQEIDSEENGHAQGYSGDFQTVNRVLDHSDKVFNSEGEAQDYCLKHATKGDSVIAVKYKVIGKVTYPKSIERLKLRLGQANEKLKAINVKLVSLSDKRIVGKKFVTCLSCKSRVNGGFIKESKCPVCHLSFITKTERKQLEGCKKVIQDLQTKLTTEYSKAKEKAAAKSTQTEWLVAGWGAC